jgi:hypothetical protein
MLTIEAKKDLILDYEQRFANELGLAIIPKPKVRVWMVLIPMYFVFHIYRHKKYVEGRRVFAANFMFSRRGVADETMEALRQNRPVNLDALSAKAKLPSKEAQRNYREWLTVLMAHYRELLTVHADDFVALVKLAYRNRSNYLLTLDQLSEAEKKFNAALRPHIKKETEDIDDVIAGIERQSTRLRRAHAQTVFPI